MYYWLKYDESEERYVISDYDDAVYIVDINNFGQSVAYKQIMDKHQLFKFKPYFEIDKCTEKFDVIIIK